MIARIAPEQIGAAVTLESRELGEDMLCNKAVVGGGIRQQRSPFPNARNHSSTRSVPLLPSKHLGRDTNSSQSRRYILRVPMIISFSRSLRITGTPLKGDTAMKKLTMFFAILGTVGSLAIADANVQPAAAQDRFSFSFYI